MTLARSDFDNLSEDDLQALKENAVSEGISLDYKRDAYGRSDAENKEFLKDITSFANTTGGHILIGVDEDEGIPTDIRGVEIDCDAEVGRLENLLRDRIEPRVVGIRLLQVPLDNGKRVLAVRIPRSWNLPHAVIQNRARIIYARNSAGVHEASVDEMRAMFTAGAAFLERAREFQRARMEQVHVSNGPAGIHIGEKGRIILHVVPFSAFSSDAVFDVSRMHGQYLPPIWCSGYNHGYNADGYFTISGGGSLHGYLQVFRNGIVETAAGDVRHNNDAGVKILHATTLENEVSDSLKNILAAFQKADVSLPVLVMLSMVRVRGTSVAGGHFGSPLSVVALPDKITLPNITIEDFDTLNVYQRALKPIFDAIWNAAGYPKSQSFDQDGNWAPERA